MFGALVDDVLEVLSIAEADVSHDADCVEGQHFFDGLIKKPDSALVPILNLERALRLGDLMGKPSRAR
jgi:chemotaxis signal transduction protein